jgi:hypothetical protein
LPRTICFRPLGSDAGFGGALEGAAFSLDAEAVEDRFMWSWL